MIRCLRPGILQTANPFESAAGHCPLQDGYSSLIVSRYARPAVPQGRLASPSHTASVCLNLLTTTHIFDILAHDFSYQLLLCPDLQSEVALSGRRRCQVHGASPHPLQRITGGYGDPVSEVVAAEIMRNMWADLLLYSVAVLRNRITMPQAQTLYKAVRSAATSLAVFGSR
jgi:hypothetical protein